jgi:hypothetical protein
METRLTDDAGITKSVTAKPKLGSQFRHGATNWLFAMPDALRRPAVTKDEIEAQERALASIDHTSTPEGAALARQKMLDDAGDLMDQSVTQLTARQETIKAPSDAEIALAKELKKRQVASIAELDVALGDNAAGDIIAYRLMRLQVARAQEVAPLYAQAFGDDASAGMVRMARRTDVVGEAAMHDELLSHPRLFSGLPGRHVLGMPVGDVAKSARDARHQLVAIRATGTEITDAIEARRSHASDTSLRLAPDERESVMLMRDALSREHEGLVSSIGLMERQAAEKLDPKTTARIETIALEAAEANRAWTASVDDARSADAFIAGKPKARFGKLKPRVPEQEDAGRGEIIRPAQTVVIVRRRLPPLIDKTVMPDVGQTVEDDRIIRDAKSAPVRRASLGGDAR